MSLPEGKIKTAEGRMVLTQDLPQYEASVYPERLRRYERQKKEYDSALGQYESDLKKYEAEKAASEKEQAAAQKQYEKDLAEFKSKFAGDYGISYESFLASEEKKAQTALNYQEQVDRYESERKKIESERDKAVGEYTQEYWKAGGYRDQGMSRSQFGLNLSKIEKYYNTSINAIESKQRVASQLQVLHTSDLPDWIKQKSTRAYTTTPFSKTSALELGTTYLTNKEVKAQQQKISNLQSTLAYSQQKRAEYAKDLSAYSNVTTGFQIGSEKYGTENISQKINPFTLKTPEFEARAADVKPTPDVITGLKAVKTRRPQINVKTGQYIYDDYFLSDDPRARKAGEMRQNVLASGIQRPEAVLEEPKKVFSFGNVKQVREESAVTLLEFQSQLKTRTAPEASVYKGILEEKGLPLTPLSQKVIDLYAAKDLTKEKQPFKEAKGRKGIIKDPKTGEAFDLETLSGSEKIAKAFGFKVEPAQTVFTFKGKEVTDPSAIALLKFQSQLKTTQPVLKGVYQGVLEERGLPLTPEAKSVIETFGDVQRPITSKAGGVRNAVITDPKTGESFDLAEGKGDRKIAQGLGYDVDQRPTTFMGGLYEKGLNVLEKEQKRVGKYRGDEVTLYQFGLDTGKDLLGSVAFLDNLGKQANKLITGKEPTTRDIDIPQTWTGTAIETTIENPSLVPLRLSEYERKYGRGSALTGPLLFAPIPTGERVQGLSKIINRITSKIKTTPPSVIVGGGAERIAKSGGKQIKSVEGNLSFPSRSWDVRVKEALRSPVQKQKTAPIGKIVTPKPEPNPFGKERRIPYTFSQIKINTASKIETAKQGIAKEIKQAKAVLQREYSFPNRSVIEGKRPQIPNITQPAKPEFNKNLESIRIGLAAKKLDLAKQFELMKKVYRTPIESGPPLYSKRLESVAIGFRMIGQRLQKKPSSPKAIKPKKTPSLTKQVKPKKIKQPSYSKTKTSIKIAKFKQQEKLSQSAKRFEKITEISEPKKEIVPSYSKNFLANLKRATGIQEPRDFKSILKPFQKLVLRKEFPSQPSDTPFGKIKGITSKKEFARLLTDIRKRPGIYNLTNIQTGAGFGIKEPTVKQLIAEGVAKERRVAKLRDVTALKAPPEITTKAGFGLKQPSIKELIKEGEFKQKRFEELQRIEKFPEITTKAGFGLKQPSVKDLIAEGIAKERRVAKLRDVTALKAPPSTIKPIFPVPRTQTELEKILQGFKAAKPKNQFYKRVRIDKNLPPVPKSWESLKGVGIGVAAGSLVFAGYQQQEAEAFPFTQIAKPLKVITSGRQVLIYDTAVPVRKIPRIVPPIISPSNITESEFTRQRRSEKFTRPLIRPSIKPVEIQNIRPKQTQKNSQSPSIQFLTAQETTITARQKRTERKKQSQNIRSAQVFKVIAPQKARQRERFSTPSLPKQPVQTLQAPTFKTKQPTKLEIITPLRPVRKPPRIAGAFAYPKDQPKTEKKKTKGGKKFTFYGNVPEAQVEGVFGRQETTYGKKKVEKLRKGDVRVLAGRSRTTRKKSEWYEGKKGDMFGFKNEAKKKKPKSLW